MKNSVMKSRKMKEYTAIIDRMYQLGWDERNGGNVSLLFDQDEVEKYLNGGRKVIRTIPLPLTVDPILKGRVFAITGTGRYFRNCRDYPEENLGIIRIADDLKNAEVLWGFENGASFTSEIYAHLLCHQTRLKVDPNHHVVMHTHPTNIVAYTHTKEPSEKEMTLDMWRVMTECVVVFPEGIGVLPWMVCGTNEIGEATAEKMKNYRVVIWWLHGIYGSGRDIDEAFGLIETIEKSAEIHLKAKMAGDIHSMNDEQIRLIAERFSLVPREGYLK